MALTSPCSPAPRTQPPGKMKTLLLVRHAKSDWSDGSLADFDRPLNGRGERDAPQMAAYLLGRGLVPELIVASPARRAYTTARVFAERFDIPENDISLRDDLYEAPTRTVLAAVRELPDHVERAAIFGHNPSLTYVVQQFSDHYVDNVPTCGVAVIKGDVATWAEMVPETGPALDVLLVPKDVLPRHRD